MCGSSCGFTVHRASSDKKRSPGSFAAAVISVLFISGAVTIVGCSFVRDSRELARHRRTIEAMGEIADGLERHKDAQGSYPRACGHLVDVRESLVPAFLPTLKAKDVWGTPFRYCSSGTSYVLWSLGSDGSEDADPMGGVSSSFDGDIILYDGMFWQLGVALKDVRRVEATENPIALVMEAFKQGRDESK